MRSYVLNRMPAVVELTTEHDHPSLSVDQVVPSLARVFPSFRRHLKKLRAFYGEPNPYLEAAGLAAAVARCHRLDRVARFPALFGAIERLLTNGDLDIRTLVNIGFFESLQNYALRLEDPEVFKRWLGPRSRRGWADIVECWNTGCRSLTAVRRRQTRRQG